MNNNTNTKQQITQCRNCKRDIRLNSRRCPYCGILNPTVKLKEIIITTVIMIVILYSVVLLNTIN